MKNEAGTGDADAKALNRVDAGIRTLEGERIRWLLGNRIKITKEGNVFGTTVNEARYDVILHKSAVEELDRNLILEELKGGPKTAKEIAKATDIPTRDVVRYLIALRKWRKIEDAGIKGKSPLYKKIE